MPPSFTALPMSDKERGAYVALGLAMHEYGKLEQWYKGRNHAEEIQLTKALHQITLAAQAVARLEDTR